MAYFTTLMVSDCKKDGSWKTMQCWESQRIWRKNPEARDNRSVPFPLAKGWTLRGVLDVPRQTATSRRQNVPTRTVHAESAIRDAESVTTADDVILYVAVFVLVHSLFIIFFFDAICSRISHRTLNRKFVTTDTGFVRFHLIFLLFYFSEINTVHALAMILRDSTISIGRATGSVVWLSDFPIVGIKRTSRVVPIRSAMMIPC